MISSEVINAMIDLIDENIRLIEEIRSQGCESFSKSFSPGSKTRIAGIDRSLP